MEASADKGLSWTKAVEVGMGTPERIPMLLFAPMND